MRGRTLTLTALLAPLVCVCASAVAAPPADEIQQLLDIYQRETGVPVATLSDDSMGKMIAGKTVYRKVTMTQSDNSRDSTTIRVLGYRVIAKPRESLWLSALAFDAGFSRRLTEHFVSIESEGGAQWYQHVNMPWPLRDRHWLIATSKNTSLTRLTEGKMWEHRWALQENADAGIREMFAKDTVGELPAEMADKAILLPKNNGAWVMATMGDGTTLVVVHATMDMGGIIPDSLVARQTRKQLLQMLSKIEADSDTAFDRYTSDYLIYRGDGSLIPPRKLSGRTTQ
ncbi:MAG: hypothetical protein AAF004_07650 [Pseudomonadota bacterium]